MVRPDDYWRILELEPGSSGDDIRRAYRDLARVWHPDRFGSDERLRQKAEAKLKQINRAYEVLSQLHGGERDGQRWSDEGRWLARRGEVDLEAGSLDELQRWVLSGVIRSRHLVRRPGTAQWKLVAETPELHEALQQRSVRQLRQYAFWAAAIALLVLFRRPSPGGLGIAVVLFAIAWVLFSAAGGKLRRTGGNRKS